MEKKVRKATRVIVIDPDGNILMIRYLETAECIPGFYDFPGGKIEEGETEFDCAIRETIEETGINIMGARKIGNVVLETDTTIFDFTIFVQQLGGKGMVVKPNTRLLGGEMVIQNARQSGTKIVIPRPTEAGAEWVTEENLREKDVTPIVAVRSLIFFAMKQNMGFSMKIKSHGDEETISYAEVGFLPPFLF